MDLDDLHLQSWEISSNLQVIIPKDLGTLIYEVTNLFEYMVTKSDLLLLIFAPC